MNIKIREYDENDIGQMLKIWNDIVDEGIAFPQTERLSEADALPLFSEKSFVGLALNEEGNEILGFYILKPNNVGRCGHIANAAYIVKSAVRGLGIGKQLVRHSIEKAKEIGFKIIQFNAVVKSNTHAKRLYEKCGFIELGTIPGGFLLKNGVYEDIILFYRCL